MKKKLKKNEAVFSMRLPLPDEEVAKIFMEFQKFADKNGIPLDNSEDWGAWWECWIDGYAEARMRDPEFATYKKH